MSGILLPAVVDAPSVVDPMDTVGPINLDPTSLIETIRPLCQETADLLKPWGMSALDALRLELDDEYTFRARVYKTDGGLGFASGEAQRWIGAIPESKYDAHGEPGTYLIAATDLTCLLIFASWSKYQIYATPAAKLLLETQALRFIYQLRLAQVQAQYKVNGLVRGDIESSDILAPYQQVAAFCAVQSDGGYGLFMEQRTGKTPSTIRAIEDIAKKAGKPITVVVVCPRNVRSNWGYELKKFATLPFAFFNCKGTPVMRKRAVFDTVLATDIAYSVIAVGFEGLGRTLATFCAVPWDIAVLDEAHNCKGYNTDRRKSIHALRDVSKKRLALTGTPICNSLNDLWAQLEFLGKGYSGFNSFEAFKQFYGVYSSDATGFDKLVSYQNVPLLQERLTRYSFVISLEQALPNLPKRVYDTVEIEMGARQKEIYDQVATELQLEVQDALDSEHPLTMKINHVLVMMLRLAQITSGFITYDPLFDFDTGEMIRAGRIEPIEPNPKLEELITAIKEAKQKVVVWAWWTQDIRTICARLTKEGIDHESFYGATSDAQREVVKQRFNTDPACRVVVANQAAGGEGTGFAGRANAETYCDLEIYYSRNWSYKLQAQSEMRPVDRDMTHNLLVRDMIVPDSIDSEMHDSVCEKKRNAMEIQDLRDMMQRVLKL